MFSASVRKKIHSLKIVDYLPLQTHEPYDKVIFILFSHIYKVDSIILKSIDFTNRSRNYQGGSDNVFCVFYYSSMFFTEGRTDLPREAIEPEGSNCFSRGVRARVSKKTIATCKISGGRVRIPAPLTPPPQDPPMYFVMQCDEIYF